MGVDAVLCVSVPVEFETVMLCVVETRLDTEETEGTVIDTLTLVLDEVVTLDVGAVAVVASVVVVEAEVPRLLDNKVTTLVDGCTELEMTLLVPATFETELTFADVVVS